MGEVSRPVRIVVPISLCEIPSQFYTVLRDYKRGSSGVRAEFTLQMGALLHRFLGTHGSCIEEAARSTWDRIAIVPSTKSGGQTHHPMEDVIGKSRALQAAFEPLVRRGPGEIANDRVAADDIFEAARDVRGVRVLVIDDTFTTGARIQSAASCFQLAGASVVAALAIGRIVNPAWSDESSALWKMARKTPFDFDVCCLE